MKKITREEIITYIIIFVITCIIFIPFLIGHYATDTYNVINIGYEKYAIEWSLNDGRIFMSAITLLAGKINLPIEAFIFITLFLALIISCLSVMQIKKVVEKYKKSKNIWQNILTVTMAYITIFNFMYIEDMYFVESFVMSVSILLFIISANILVEKQEKYYLIKTLLLVITGIMFYQGSICMFFIMTLFISILKNKNNVKQIFIDVIECGVIALISAVLNVLLIKCIGKIYGMEQTRLSEVNEIFKNIYKIAMNTYVIITGCCNLYPQYLYMALVAIIILITVGYVIEKQKEKSIIIKILAIVIMGILSSSVTFILALTSFYSGRLRISIGATIGMLFILLYIETEIFENKTTFKYLITTLLMFYTFTNVFGYVYLMLQHKEVNRIEKIEIQEIDKYITEYEEQTGTEIKNIVKVRVPNRASKAYYSWIKNKSTLTYTAVRSDLAADCAINFYTKRHLKTVTDFDYKGITKEFKERVLFSKEGYFCEGDTFYINVYMY